MKNMSGELFTVIVIGLIVVISGAMVLIQKNNNKSNSNKVAETTATPTTSPTSGDTAVYSAHKVKLSTSKGDIVIKLYPEDAPKTVQNFVTLGKRGYYNNVTFHRVIKDFMIQGGDPTGTGSGGESIFGAKFDDEINSHKIVAGTVAMANSGKNTNGSQFFIVTESAQTHLDGVHTAFGDVDPDSMSVVRAIAAVQVDSSDKPVEAVTMTGFSVIEE